MKKEYRLNKVHLLVQGISNKLFYYLIVHVHATAHRTLELIKSIAECSIAEFIKIFPR